VNIPEMVSGVHGWMPEPRTANHIGKELHLPPASMPAKGPVEPVDWNATGKYSAVDWEFEYHFGGVDQSGRPGLHLGRLTYRGFSLNVPDGHRDLNDTIDTPWGMMYWFGMYRHPWGYQGWQSKPMENTPIGRKLVPGQILAMDITFQEAYSSYKERLSERVRIIVAGLLGIRSPALADGWDELKAFQMVMKRDKSFVAPEAVQLEARGIAASNASAAVMQADGYWIVLEDKGNPAAGGSFRIVIIDDKTKKVLKTIGTRGGHRPSTMPADR